MKKKTSHPDQFNYQQLFYFHIAARFGNISSAAQSLNLAQSNLSVHLKKLEAALSKRLFNRSSRGIRLTREGEVLRDMCAKMFAHVDEIEAFVRYPRTNIERKIRIGISPDIERPFITEILAPLVEVWHSRYNAIIELVSTDNERLVEDLRSRRLDVLFANFDVHAHGVAKILDRALPVVGVVRPSPALRQLGGKLKQMNFGALRTYLPKGLVLPSARRRLRGEIDVFLARLPERPKVVLESDILAPIARAVRDRVGYSFLPLHYMASEIRRGEFITFGPPSGYWRHWISVYAPKDQARHAITQDVKRQFERL